MCFTLVCQSLTPCEHKIEKLDCQKLGKVDF
nr:MAG TPA: hypothetical protein [Bacteriophage sp.]